MTDVKTMAVHNISLTYVWLFLSINLVGIKTFRTTLVLYTVTLFCLATKIAVSLNILTVCYKKKTIIYLQNFILFPLQEIQPSLQELALDTYGRKVLMYLLCPRSPAHFHPTVVELLKKGDGNSNRYEQPQDCSCIDYLTITVSCYFHVALTDDNSLLLWCHLLYLFTPYDWIICTCFCCTPYVTLFCTWQKRILTSMSGALCCSSDPVQAAASINGELF